MRARARAAVRVRGSGVHPRWVSADRCELERIRRVERRPAGRARGATGGVPPVPVDVPRSVGRRHVEDRTGCVVVVRSLDAELLRVAAGVRDRPGGRVSAHRGVRVRPRPGRGRGLLGGDSVVPRHPLELALGLQPGGDRRDQGRSAATDSHREARTAEGPSRGSVRPGHSQPLSKASGTRPRPTLEEESITSAVAPTFPH